MLQVKGETEDEKDMLMSGKSNALRQIEEDMLEEQETQEQKLR